PRPPATPAHYTLSLHDALPIYNIQGIELVVVDGPPQATGELARYPALPTLAEHLAPEARILFDDANRPDETRALEAWREAYPLRSEEHTSELQSRFDLVCRLLL